MVRGGGHVVSVLAFYFNNPSSNPAEAYSFLCKICVWQERKKIKEAGVGPLFSKILTLITPVKSATRVRVGFKWSSYKTITMKVYGYAKLFCHLYARAYDLVAINRMFLKSKI